MMGRKIMGETGIKPIVIEEICDLAKKYNVKKVILFGSRARGSFKEKSDNIFFSYCPSNNFICNTYKLI